MQGSLDYLGAKGRIYRFSLA